MPSRTMHVALEQQAHELVDRARRAAERSSRARRGCGGTSASCLHSSRSSCSLSAATARRARSSSARLRLRRTPAWRSHSVGRRGAEDRDALVAHAGREVLQEVDRVGAAQLEVLDDDHDRVRSASAVSKRLSAMNRRASRRCGDSSSGVDDRAVVERHAQQVRDQVRDLGDARRPARPRRRPPGSCRGSRPDPRRARGRTARSARARSGRRRARSRRRRPAARCTFGYCVRARAISSPSMRLLPMPGSPMTTANASRRLLRTRLSISSCSCSIAAARPVNFGRRSYGVAAVMTVRSPSPSPKPSPPSSIGLERRRRLGAVAR